MSDSMYLTRQQVLDSMKRQLEAIKRGKPLDTENSDAMGDKHTECSWGMCTEGEDVFPKGQGLRMFDDERRPKYRASMFNTEYALECPLREGINESGCFYQCRVFQRNKKTPTREEAITLYEDRIAKLSGIIKGEP
jgi:hypothetical protein